MDEWIKLAKVPLLKISLNEALPQPTCGEQFFEGISYHCFPLCPGHIGQFKERHRYRRRCSEKFTREITANFRETPKKQGLPETRTN